jgi:nucleotide-binding universal stress UspA family protein
MNQPIVVGIDGSTQSWTALELAGREAVMRHRSLRIVHAFAWPWPAVHMPDRPPPDDLEAISVYAQANEVAAAAVARAHHAQRALNVCGEVGIGFPAQVLATASQTALMVVIGHRDLGRIDRLVRGTVAAQLMARTSCPLLVSRGRADPSGNVLLDVDAASTSSRVLSMAVEEAVLRGVAVDVPTSGGIPADTNAPARRRTTPQQLDQHVSAGTRTGSRQALIDATARAQLVVVGFRPGRTLSGRLLPSTSHTVLHHARCPVLMVPDHDPPAATWPKATAVVADDSPVAGAPTGIDHLHT